ncbi:MAG: hypothetical protein HZA54_17350 [Planctomycetes bacterium]|nr:hypothetical protein [Planctomycetota bacterium]
MTIHDLVGRLGDAERRCAGTLFLAPVPAGGRGRVRVRIAGVVCELTVAGPPGWQVCRARDATRADVVEAADRIAVRRFLQRLPALQAVVAVHGGVGGGGAAWFGLPVNPRASALRVEGLFPVRLAEGLRDFDAVVVRFDGGAFLFDDRDRRRDPSLADYLRRALADLRPVEELAKRGLAAGERALYAWRLERRREAERPEVERRLARAVAHGGATLEGYVERGDEISVTYRVDRRSYTSVVRAAGLEVVSAGICLSGADRSFDLASLVGVLRAARRPMPGEED